MTELFTQFTGILFHLDTTLNEWVTTLGHWFYAAVFAIVFCETGLVVTPFLPGDSLLFALGALSSTENAAVSLPIVMVVLMCASMLGDSTNYWIGYSLGPKVFHREDSWVLNKKHLTEAHAFYVRHGGKAIILCRFVPIIRTFAPFVAGVGRMSYLRFLAFSVSGSIAWVGLLTSAGAIFGQTPFVKKHFEMVVVGIIFVSILPGVIAFAKKKLAERKSKAGPSDV